MAGNVSLPYLYRKRVKGHLYTYYRRGKRLVRIEGEPGSAAFLRSYSNIHETFTATGLQQPTPGSLAAVIREFYAAPEFRQLGENTKRDYVRALDGLCERFGELPVASMPRAFAFRVRDELLDRPRWANYVLAILKRLLSFAVDRGHIASNPALRVKGLKTGPGHRPWRDSELARFRDHWPASSLERVALELMLCSAQRAGDIVKLTRANYEKGWLRLRQGKTGAIIEAPVPTPVQAMLDGHLASHDAVTLLTHAGKPLTRDHFGRLMRKAFREAGLPDDVTLHGLRHTAATILAEQGLDWRAIASLTGHRTAGMVAHYSRQRRDASAAVTAIGKPSPGSGKPSNGGKG